jgi:hypothetical protein
LSADYTAVLSLSDFPGDDRLELESLSAQAHYDGHGIQQKLNSESQAGEILARADGIMKSFKTGVGEAVRFSTWGMRPIV